MVETPCPQCRGTGSIPGWRTKVLHASGHGKKHQQKSPLFFKIVFLQRMSLHYCFLFKETKGKSLPSFNLFASALLDR